jgi:hypothetical protein
LEVDTTVSEKYCASIFRVQIWTHYIGGLTRNLVTQNSEKEDEDLCPDH